MRKIVNGGIYQVEFDGSHDSEFNAKHPALILQNLKEEEIFYIIPLTTYTKEKWNKLRKYYCSRIISTNSIARIDKIQVRHISSIPNRWFSSYRVLYPSPEELENVYKKMSEYISLSILKGKEEYEKYYKNHIEFKTNCDKFFKDYEFDDYLMFNLSFTSNALIITCDLNMAKELTFEDIRDIFREYFNSDNLIVRFKKDIKKIIITVKLIDEKALTLKEKHDNIMVSKG